MGDEYILSCDVRGPLNPPNGDFDCVFFVCHKDSKAKILFLLLPLRGIESCHEFTNFFSRIFCLLPSHSGEGLGVRFSIHLKMTISLPKSNFYILHSIFYILHSYHSTTLKLSLFPATTNAFLLPKILIVAICLLSPFNTTSFRFDASKFPFPLLINTVP